MRPVIIAANWKMNTTPADAGELAATIAARIEEPGVTRVICPPYVCLSAVHQALAATDVAVGAQNVHHEQGGAYTGEISAGMLSGLASWVILGHSERRRDQLESDELIGKKLARAIASGLRPILCVGEQLAERAAW
jgi:triosephosphate isomerase